MEETNASLKCLREPRENTLSAALDCSTLHRYHSDEPEAIGEFARWGVAVSSVKDMEMLFDRISPKRRPPP